MLVRKAILSVRGFDVMLADLGGLAPSKPALSDELRERLDPDLGPPVHCERTVWFIVEAVRWNLPRRVLLPNKHLQHLRHLHRQVNDAPAWRQCGTAASLMRNRSSELSAMGRIRTTVRRTIDRL